MISVLFIYCYSVNSATREWYCCQSTVACNKIFQKTRNDLSTITCYLVRFHIPRNVKSWNRNFYFWLQLCLVWSPYWTGFLLYMLFNERLFFSIFQISVSYTCLLCIGVSYKNVVNSQLIFSNLSIFPQLHFTEISSLT